jgi:hypothetical protein
VSRLAGILAAAVTFALFSFGSGVSAAGYQNLILAASERVQSAGDVDFSRAPVWRAVVRCSDRNDDVDCLLERMTASPSEVPPDWIVAAALNLARFFDGRLRSESNGLDDLRSAQAYLVAAAYEARSGQAAKARADFQTALERANGAERSQYIGAAQLVTVYAKQALSALGHS